MCVINRNGILSHDVIFKGKLSSDKYLDMTYYEDSIRIPSRRVIDHFGERINYANPVETIFYLEDEGSNKRLRSIIRNSEVLSFVSYSSMIEFLEGETYIFYFVKCHELVGGGYNLYVYMVDNLLHIRNKRLEELGI
jgi:hypothetical protein